MIKYNKDIMKFDSDSILISTDTDFTGYTFKYLVKARLEDKDNEAVLNLTPQLTEVNGFKKILVPFSITDLRNIKEGNYYHALKAIKDSTAITLMIGTLTIIGEYIRYPEVI